MKRTLSLVALSMLLGAFGCSSSSDNDGTGGTAGDGGAGGDGGTGGGLDLCGNPIAERDEGDPGDGNYEASIVYTTYGIPHVTADDWGSLGYGAGYAYAKENFCVLMREIVRANGESLRWFGEDEGSLANDLVYRFFASDEYIENEFIPAGSEQLQALAVGYAEGLNRYLNETGVEGLPEGPEGCRGEDWVREVDEIDLAKVYRKLILRAGIGTLAPLIAAADAPTMSLAATSPQPELRESVEIPSTAWGLPEETAMGSNAYGIGAEASQTGYGLLLGNPHFPWRGPERWFIQHLTIPGVYDVMGASLQGVPVVNIGFNSNLAWSHTVSTARRFTGHELHLLEDDPMKYMYDDEVRDIETFDVTIEVMLEDGSIEQRVEQVYMSQYGPIADLGPVNGALGGWPTASNTVFAIGDANIDNTRALNQFQRMGQSQCVAELDDALKLIGLPWVNTIAADRDGTGYYADVTTVPNVSAEKLADCSDSLFAALLTQNRFFTLNGSRSECEWGTDDDGPEGLLGYDNLPKLFTSETVPYTSNSNDSYWLSNPNELLEGFSPLIGNERVQQSLRTRQGFVQAEERIAGTDDLDETPGFTIEHLQQMLYGNRNIAEELTRDDVLTICQGVDDWSPYSDNPQDADTACDILGTWDGRFDNDSVGAAIWNEFWRRVDDLGDDLWVVPFDADDPVNTPNTLNDEDPAVVEAVKGSLGAGVDFLIDGGIPLDRPWGEVQFRPVGEGEQIPIHGGSGRFMFSVISAQFVPGVGYADIPTGNSYIQTVTFDETECPDAFAVLTYSQSTNPESPHFADLTQVYSDETWNDMPYCDADIEAAQISEETISSTEN
jgi:acyl-homoserine-lactone acylase